MTDQERGVALALAIWSCRECHGLGIANIWAERKGPGRHGSPRVCHCVLRKVTRSVLHKCRSIERQTAVMGLSIRRSLSHGWLTYSIPKAEFVADVQQLAWNCLDPLERRVFQLHLLDGRQQPECSRRLRMDRGNFYHAKYRVEQKVGQAFLDAGLYPFNVYFKFAEQAFAVAC